MIFPFDSVKTHMQTGDERTKIGFIQAAKAMYAQGGIRAFYRGYGVCILRAAPANAVTFMGYEWTMGILNREKKL